jgi:hypothetical protein
VTGNVCPESSASSRTAPRPRILFRNRGASFEDVSARSHGDHAALSRGAAFGDFDNDGDLDVLVGT